MAATSGGGRSQSRERSRLGQKMSGKRNRNNMSLEKEGGSAKLRAMEEYKVIFKFREQTENWVYRSESIKNSRVLQKC